MSDVDSYNTFEHDALGAVLWAPFYEYVLGYVLAATDNNLGYTTQQTAVFLDFRHVIAETNSDPSLLLHWSQASVRSRFRLVCYTHTHTHTISLSLSLTHSLSHSLTHTHTHSKVGGTWTAVTQGLSCVLCETGKLKPWHGPGRCERCSERVLPWARASWERFSYFYVYKQTILKRQSSIEAVYSKNTRALIFESSWH